MSTRLSSVLHAATNRRAGMLVALLQAFVLANPAAAQPATDRAATGETEGAAFAPPAPSGASETAAPPLALSPEEATTRQVPAPIPPPPEPLPDVSERVPTPGAVSEAPALAVDASPRRGPYVHDGFYLRAAFGANYGRALIQTNRLSEPDARIIGMGQALDVWAGRTVPPGFVIGFGLGFSDVSTDAADLANGESVEGKAFTMVVSGFLDAYPDPTDGYHFGGALGMALLSADAGGSDFLGTGVAFSVFAGYDAWIGRQLSLGGLLRLGGSVAGIEFLTDGNGTIRQGTTYGAQLLATAVYH